MQGILKIKLGRSLSCPTRRLHEQLAAAAREWDRVQAALFQAWLQWRGQNDWHPPPATKKSGESWLWRGCQVPKNQPLPPGMPGERKTQQLVRCTNCKERFKPVLNRQVMPCPHCGAEKDLSLTSSTWLSRQVQTELSGKIVSLAARTVLSDLGDKTSYRSSGSARWVWQAILQYEQGLPCPARGRSVPVVGQDAKLHWDDGGLTLSIAVWGRHSGRPTRYKARLIVGRHSKKWSANGRFRHSVTGLRGGQKRVLREVYEGKRKLADSELVFDERRRAWYFHLVYEFASADESPGEQVAELRMDRERGLVIANGESEWELGNRRMIKGEVHRIMTLRHTIRFRSRKGAGAGHGKNGFYSKLRPRTRALDDLAKRYRKSMAAEAVRFCKRFGCGKLLWREPKLGARSHTWFSENGIFFDYTDWQSKLAAACYRAKIDLEVREGRRGDEEAVAARSPEASGVPGVTTLNRRKKRLKGAASGQVLADDRVRRGEITGSTRRRRSG